MAETPTPLASNKEDREEHSFLHGSNGEEVQNADGRGPEHPRKIWKTGLDRMKHGIAAENHGKDNSKSPEQKGHVRYVP